MLWKCRPCKHELIIAEKEFTTFMTVTRTISSRESSCLAICKSLHVSVHFHLFFVQTAKKLVFVPIASAMTAPHRGCVDLACNAQQPEIQHLSWGQILSTDHLLWTGGHTWLPVTCGLLHNFRSMIWRRSMASFAFHDRIGDSALFRQKTHQWFLTRLQNYLQWRIQG